jgi:tetratricopeptide (TPR) repeat protein
MRLVMAVVAAAIFAYASPARAQDQPPAPAPPAATATAPTQADEDAAKAHFLAGSAYYEQADYNDAVKEFNEAHRLSRRPDLLYNISVCYERLGRWDDAIASLKQYLTEKPDAPDRAVIESRIANYEQRRQQEQARVAAQAQPVVTPPPATPPTTNTRHVASWIVGGIGAGLLVAALGTGVTAQLTYNDLQTKCGGKICNGNDQTLVNEQSFGRALTISTDVLLAAGGATLVTGVILFIVEWKKGRAARAERTPSTAQAAIAPAAGGALVRF